MIHDVTSLPLGEAVRAFAGQVCLFLMGLLDAKAQCRSDGDNVTPVETAMVGQCSLGKPLHMSLLPRSLALGRTPLFEGAALSRDVR